MNNSDLINWLKENQISFERDYEISKKSWIKCGGTVELLIKPENYEDSIKTLKYLRIWKRIGWLICMSLAEIVIYEMG